MAYDIVDRAVAACEGTELDIYTSMESVGAQAEYIRDGLDYDRWCYNMTQIMDAKLVRGLHVMCTINALCLESLPELLTQLMSWKSQAGADFPSFTLNILRFPSFQSALVLPDEIRTHHKQCLQTWLDTWDHNIHLHEHERNHVQRLIDYLDVVKTPHSDAFDRASLLNDFKQFYTQYDQRRGQDFAKAFPNLADWYNDIQV
jgi:hypothetical protein